MRALFCSLLVLVASAGCNSDKLGKPCTSKHDCGFGAFCASRICTRSCETDADCAKAPGMACKDATLARKGFLGESTQAAKLCLPPSALETATAGLAKVGGDIVAKMRADLDRKSGERMKKLSVKVKLMPVVANITDAELDAAWNTLPDAAKAGTPESLVPLLVEKLKASRAAVQPKK